ncbi:baculoviral IAP repeat-containing protein 7-like [Zingiber officinale]|uniref:RING-type domain-containing protein n=1 Tax=Zingiber officinale TaxID=94328 RepID=A0A8J5GWT3_ZINOF|nr:baculoviral IAP repeat-containing protein 7-like [Zingiber officinale]XP_042378211.1 baculoviral IAP repeat-containing protein 7-like [Zingiber officinale]KAG6515605.1 hypothetical protein ZIOFF_026034 [Zingiber officinale]
MEWREIRRSVTLSEQLSINDSSSLGDLLKLREEEEATRLSGRESLTLESVIRCEKGEYSAAGGGHDASGRTLLGVILQEHEASSVAAEGDSSNGASWKTLRDRFRLQSDGAASPDQLLPISNPDPVDSPSPSRSNLNSDLAVPEPTVVAVEATSQPEVPSADSSGAAVSPIPAAVPEEEAEEPARVSLMALLEQTDRQWSGSERERLPMAAAAVEAVMEAEAESGGGVMSYMCCVCMVRHKGAAFIPCGHTFCRTCSRELWISRGSCPLCNREILEILDIF